MKKVSLKFCNKKLVILALAALWTVLCLFLTPVYTTVTLNFAEDPHGEVIVTVFAGPREQAAARDARYRVVNRGIARVSYLDVQIGSRCALKRIDPLDQYYKSGEPLTLTGMTVSKNGIPVLGLDGGELRECFTVNGDMELLEGEDFTFLVTGEDPQMLPTDAFKDLYGATPFSVKILGILIFGGGICLFVLLVLWLQREISGWGLFYRCTAVLLSGGLLGAVFLTVYVGFRNPFYLNPDEIHTLTVVEHYFSHFMPPDMRDPAIINSYAIYGTTRHSEWNLFYFLTAKTGQAFTDEIIRVRLFTVITFCIMAGMALKNIRKNSALLFAVLLTPQVWYLFSYCTSDSYDYFMSFLCLYELIRKDSMLNQVIGKPFCKKHIWYVFLLGLLFVQILWGKPSFYPVLIFVFLILLIRLFYPWTDGWESASGPAGDGGNTGIEEKRKVQRTLLFRYLTILGATLVIFALRYMITDFPYYGFAKYDVYMEMLEKTADYGYKFSTPPMERAYSMSFMEKGVTLGEFLTGFDFNKNLFRTFAGFFGSYAFGAADWYYMVMGMLYLALLGYFVYRVWRAKSAKAWWELAVAVFTMGVHYALIVYNGWVIDFQPQGRYLVPILIYGAFLAYRADREGKDKVFRVFLCLTCLLSLYCFYTYGVYNLVPMHGMQG